ncbi:MAG: lysophospholipid acyltransferase family protein [Candidatus Cloacimonetes bacterium]|nr:lysophospholipid acyltransferase family protein [Candidatus Cloacimonadota bacterium]
MFQNLLEILFFKFFFYFIKILPLSFALAIAKILALLNFYFLKIRKEIVIKQLKIAFPEKSKNEIKQIAKNTFINFSKNAIEFCKFSSKKLSKKEKYVTISGFENIDSALSKGKGLILVMGHFGNWEFASQIIGLKTKKLYAVAQTQRNPFFNKFVNKIRTQNKIHLIPKKHAFRGIVKALRQNNIVGMLGDQNAGKRGIFVNFFGRPASTYSGIAKTALKLGCPIVFATCLRKSNGKMQAQIGKPIFLKQTKNLDLDVKKYTQELTSLLENEIRKFPSQWFWLHRRWKTKNDEKNH